MLDKDIEDFGVGYVKGVEGSDFTDYITVSFARRVPTRLSNKTYGDCVIPLKNDFGSGYLRLTNSPLCEEAQ